MPWAKSSWCYPWYKLIRKNPGAHPGVSVQIQSSDAGTYLSPNCSDMCYPGSAYAVHQPDEEPLDYLVARIVRSAWFFPARWRTYIRRAIRSSICGASIVSYFMRALSSHAEYPYCRSEADAHDYITLNQCFHFLVDDTCSFIRHCFAFATLRPRNTSPSSSAYRVDPISQRSPTESPCYVPGWCNFNIVGRTGRNMFRPVDDLSARRPP